MLIWKLIDRYLGFCNPKFFVSGGGRDTASSTDVGDIGHSLRFRGAQYLSKTFVAPTSNTSWALSMWVKRGTLSSARYLFCAADTGFHLNASDQLLIIKDGTAVVTSTAVFREPTSFVHLFFVSNGTNVRAYYDTVLVATYTGTMPEINSAIAHYFSRYGLSATGYCDDYMARICFVDGGGSLTPQDFVYLNTETNKWTTKTQAQIKAVVDAGGANSFMLDFDNGTSLTTLGYDKSSKGNNWTLNGHSLTLGSTYDWMLDVPGNSFATASPIDNNGVSISSGNLVVGSTVSGNGQRSTFSFDIALNAWYAEFQVSSVGYTAVGVSQVGYGFGNSTYRMYYRDGTKFNGSSWTAYGNSYNDTDVIGIAVKNGKVFFSKNGVWQNSSDPVAETNPAFTGLTGVWSIAFQNQGAGTSGGYWFFGQAPLHASATYDAASGGYFRYTPPTGFKALCQANLPEPAIKNPKNHFDVVLATGASIKSTAEAVFPSNFMEWIKDRANSNNWQQIDTVRGSSAVLQSNTTAVETTYTAPSGSSVGFVWKLGGAAVTNNAGSISSQVSANVEAGQSIATYTGTGANATVGHGLGGVAELVVVKGRVAGLSWPVYHSSQNASPASGLTYLNGTAAFVAAADVWNSTAPTSSVFSIGTNGQTNQNTTQFVAFCFRSIPGYSKVGSYTGNGAADGPFAHCGFKPRYLLIKSATSATDWLVIDSARDTFNQAQANLYPSLPNAEAGNSYIDFTATGFKIRSLGSQHNVGTNTYIYYAVADIAGKYS